MARIEAQKARRVRRALTRRSATAQRSGSPGLRPVNAAARTRAYRKIMWPVAQRSNPASSNSANHIARPSS